MSNFKSAAKRKRELAKLDKRQAKEQKRALRRTGQPGAAAGAPATSVTGVVPAKAARPEAGAAVLQKPLTLAEAAERWRKTKVVKPKSR
jgi:hypothetical protein